MRDNPTLNQSRTIIRHVIPLTPLVMVTHSTHHHPTAPTFSLKGSQNRLNKSSVPTKPKMTPE